MTTFTEETETAREYGVRIWEPGAPIDGRIIPCGDDLAAAEAILATPPDGSIAVEIVGRPAHTWQAAPEGLIASIRTTAEQLLDKEIGEDVVLIRLARWLPNRSMADVFAGAWPELLEDIETYRRADDEGVDLAALEPEWRDEELYVQHLDGCVIDAVKRVIGGAA